MTNHLQVTANQCFQDVRPTEIPEDHHLTVPDDHFILDLPQTHNATPLPSVKFNTPEKLKTSTRIIIIIVVITALFVGKFGVPDNEISCIQDKILNAFENANKFINAPANERFRDAFQILCSLMMDIVFVLTFGYWVLHARTARLPIALGLFYIVRALVQNIWLSPFPEGYYWESPGIPSFVVPYGRGSDFFFSGHTGFLIICACEWSKLGFTKMRNFVLGVAVYTILILLIYRIHYSIDIFTGVIFAQWCFDKIDLVKEKIENAGAFVWIMIQQFSIEFAKIVCYN